MLMNMKKITIIAAAVLGLFATSSCAKMLEVAPPNKITDDQIQNILINGSDEQRELISNATAAPFAKYFNFWNIDCGSTGALAPMTYCYQGIEWARTLQGNDVICGANNQANGLAGLAYYDGSAQYQNGDFAGNGAHWFGYAYTLNQANLLLSTMTAKAAEASNAAKDGRIRGLTVRAYSYLRLMEEYRPAYTGNKAEKSGLPLYDTYSPGQEPKAPASEFDTWEFIKNDLKEAVKLAKEEGIGYTTAYDKLEDFDLGLCNYLLALACIDTKDWDGAIAACDEIIRSNAYSFIANSNYGGQFKAEWLNDKSKIVLNPEDNAFTALKKNPECIFGYIKTSTYNPKTQADLACAHTRLANPFGSYSKSGATARIDDRLYNKIADEDCRKNAFLPEKIVDYTDGNATWTIYSHSAMKFAATKGLKDGGADHSDASLVDENEFCKFRYSEVVLMKAEALAQKGTSPAAALDLLLDARTSGTYTTETYPAHAGLSNLEKVQLQYRIEMWGENGREYFNNKRWGINVNRTGSEVHWCKDVKINASDMVINIPVKETETNPNY